MLTEDLLQRVSEGELASLIELDARGLLLGVREPLEAYVTRLRCLRQNFATMDQALAQSGRYEVEGMVVEAGARIPPERFEPARQMTRSLYAIDPDWVPGFYVNPRHGWLFGGCAFYFYPDFFVLFIIRRSFATRERWLIYDRRELLAHELCHVARVGMASRVFEEALAYRTAQTRFRMEMGSVFRSPYDSYALLGSTVLLLAAQLARLAAVPQLPIWPFWSLVAGVAIFLASRHGWTRRLFRRAHAHLVPLAGSHADAVLLRCSDEEIRCLAAMDRPEDLQEWLDFRCRTDLRWQIIGARFLAGADDTAARSAAPGGEPTAEPSPGPNAEANASLPAETESLSPGRGPTSGPAKESEP